MASDPSTLTAVSADEERAMRAAVPTWYSGRLHWLVINTVGLGVIVLSARALRDPQWWEWLFIPGFFVFSNGFEWWVHRGPMHHPTQYARLLYQRHTLEHHRLFPHDRMGITSPQELYYILFPWWFLPAILAVNLPIPLLLGAFVSRNIAMRFWLSVFAYYLTYEWFHFCHHMPPDSWIGRRWIVGLARLHHTRHHELGRMTKGNFNVSFPLWDWLLGSLLPAAPGEPA